MSAWTRILAMAAAAALASCATDSDRVVEAMRTLSADARSDLDKFRQFMTERQVERYVLLPVDEDRRRFLASLHIEDRLAKYPAHVQEAIWGRRIVPGMDIEAIYLSWGRPDGREVEDTRQQGGNVEESWHWRRTGPKGEKGAAKVLVSNGLVIDVIEFEAD